MEFTGAILLNGEAELNVTNFFSLSSRWATYYDDQTQLESFWNIGEGQQYWYRIEGICSKLSCSNMGVELQDEQCETDYLFLTVVSAASLKEMCQVLKKPTLNPPAQIKINSVKRYSRPVLKDSNIENNCNILIEEQICHIPECFDFCLNDVIELLIPFNFTATRVFNHFPTLTNVNISGGFEIFNNWHKEFLPEITNVNLNSETEYTISKLNFDTAGSLTLESNFYYLSNFYLGQATGQIDIEGSVTTRSSSYNYQSKNITIYLDSGYSKIKRDIELNWQLSLNGNAYNIFSYNGYGTLNIASNNEIVSPRYTYSSNGFVYIESNFYVNVKNQGLVSFNFNLESKVSKPTVEYIESIASNNLSINQQIISVPCACSDLPLFLNLNHGLKNANILKDFLKRNSLTLADDFIIRYKSKNKSWQSNAHFKGYGQDGILREDWLFIFDLCCFEDFGDSYWKFLMFIKRSLNNNEDFETKLMLDIPNDISCVDNGLSLNIRYDIFSSEFYVNNNFLISNIHYDEIGLFKNNFWTNNPNFVIRIGSQTNYNPDPVINLRPIFTP